MSVNCKPPSIRTAVSTTFVGLFALAGCFGMVKAAGTPDVLALTFILANVALIGLAVLQWVLYFRGYVDFRIDQLRQEQHSSVSQPQPTSVPASD